MAGAKKGDESKNRIVCDRNGAYHARKQRSDAWTDAQRGRFLDHLAATCNVDASAAAVERSPDSAKGLRRRDPDFAFLWDEALETGYAMLEALLLERAQQSVSGSKDAAISNENISPAVARRTSMTLKGEISFKDAIDLLNRHRAQVTRIRQGKEPGHQLRAASAKETYMVLLERMRVLKLRLEQRE